MLKLQVVCRDDKEEIIEKNIGKDMEINHPYSYDDEDIEDMKEFLDSFNIDYDISFKIGDWETIITIKFK